MILGLVPTGKFCVRIIKTCYKILEGDDALGVEKKNVSFFIYFLLLSKRLKLSAMMKNGDRYGSFDGSSIGGGMAGGEFDDGKIRTIWLVIVVSVAIIVEYTKENFF